MAAEEPTETTRPGLRWDLLVDGLARDHGSLAAVAERLCEHRRWQDDRASVERALRRLRGRGQRSGGLWGERLVACFGLPLEVEARARWMGVYHSRFTDLPVALCEEQLQLWARPPVWETPSRAWLEMGFASVALRRQLAPQALAHASQARSLAPKAGPGAMLEVGLLEGFLESRVEPEARALARLERLAPLLEAKGLPEEDRACWRARWVDQVAWVHTHASPPRLEQARALFEGLPEEAPPFARCRRHNGLAWVHYRLGDLEGARALASLSVRDAGDAGLLRLRAMALTLRARITGDEGDRARAVALTRALGDDALAHRLRPRALGAVVASGGTLREER